MYADYVDNAAQSTIDFDNVCLAAHHAKNKQINEYALSVTECIDCGETIPPKRKQYKPDAIRCVHCQAIYDEEN